MARVTNGVATRRRRKRVLKIAKGQFGQRSKNFRQAKKSVVKGLAYAFRDRKAKKREFKSLWIIRINAACREAGLTYSRFMNGLTMAKIEINRKLIADMAVNTPEAFNKLIEVAKENSKAAK